MSDPSISNKKTIKTKITEFFMRLKSFVGRNIKTKISELRNLPYRKIIRAQWREFVSGIVMPLYPLAIFLVLFYYFTLNANAGVIRQAVATEDKPTVIKLAKGRRTAIHFWEKPERVIPGSPGKIQIDFLGNDVTVAPIANDPGNLLVYAKGARFVVLFQMASKLNYDDVVKLVPGKSKATEAIRLDQDIYQLANFKVFLEKSGTKNESESQALLKNGGKFAIISDLGDLNLDKRMKCEKCVYSRSDTALICKNPITKVECHAPGNFKLSLQRIPE